MAGASFNQSGSVTSTYKLPKNPTTEDIRRAWEANDEFGSRVANALALMASNAGFQKAQVKLINGKTVSLDRDALSSLLQETRHDRQSLQDMAAQQGAQIKKTGGGLEWGGLSGGGFNRTKTQIVVQKLSPKQTAAAKAKSDVRTPAKSLSTTPTQTVYTPSKSTLFQDFPGSGANTVNQSQADAAYGITSSDLNAIPVIIKHGGGKPNAQGHSTDLVENYLFTVARPSNWTASQISSLQDLLIQSGYLKNDKSNIVQKGIFGMTDGTIQAYEQAVLDAARSGKTTTELLNSTIAARTAAGIGSGTGVGAQNPITYTSDDDLRAAAMQAGQNLLGRNPDDSFIDNFIKSFHASEARSQTAANANQNSTSPATPETAAEAQLRSQQPQQVQARSVGTGVETLDNLIQSTKGNG